jgi:hypothetical protein
MGDKLLGTFHYIYASDAQGIGGFGTATFTSVEMPELVEIPQFATIDINQDMLSAIRNFLGQRRIKRFITYDGYLRLSYYLTHPNAGSIINTMIRSAVSRNHDGVTHARVMGGLGWAEYKSTNLNRGVRHFVEANLDTVMDRSVAYIEAKALVVESIELEEQANFSGHPNLKLEPEDKLNIQVTAQSINADYVIDDITTSWQNHEILQEVGTRQTYVE